MTTSGDWLGASADNIRITYKQGETTLPSAPTDAGTYTAGITVGEGEGAVTASVEYTIAPKELTDPTLERFQIIALIINVLQNVFVNRHFVNGL